MNSEIRSSPLQLFFSLSASSRKTKQVYEVIPNKRVDGRPEEHRLIIRMRSDQQDMMFLLGLSAAFVEVNSDECDEVEA